MPVVRSIEELSRYFNGNAESILGQKATMEKLEAQATELEFLLKTAILGYYNSYTPVEHGYVRTYNLYNSVQVEPPQIDGNIIYMRVTFNELMANHPSLWGGEDGYVPMLIDTGWHIKWSKPYRVPRLSDFDGYPYIQQVIDEYNSNNNMGLHVEVYFDGERIY